MTHQLVLNWVRSGESIANTVTVTADGEVNSDFAVAPSATNYEVDFAIDVSALQSLLISSDKNLTVKTNSTSSPGDTLAITAGNPLIWYVGCGMACPLTADVTKIYCSRTGGDAATGSAAVKTRALQDVTPA